MRCLPLSLRSLVTTENTENTEKLTRVGKQYSFDGDEEIESSPPGSQPTSGWLHLSVLSVCSVVSVFSRQLR